MLLPLLFMWLTPVHLADDEAVIFFPSMARMTDQNTWVVHIHGWIFEPEHGSDTRGKIKTTLQKTFGELSQTESQLFDQRMSWFLVDNERGKRITIQLGARQFELKRSKAGGHFKEKVVLRGTAAQIPKTFRVVLAEGDQRTFEGRIHLVHDGGWAVISDIDDTLKISGVLDKEELLRNTFCRPFQVTPGFPEMYAKWANQGATFHYLSASPWQLYPALRDFMRSHSFPAGAFYLRPLRIKDHTFTKFLFADKLAYKSNHVLDLYKTFPKKRFLLVGDSGEKDPEVYAAIAKRFPERTLAILIREVHPNPNPQRMATVRSKIGSIPLIVFRDSQILKDFSPLAP